MQLHLDKPCFEPGAPWLNATNPDRPLAILPFGPFELYIDGEEEADQLIAVACQIKDMLVQHTAMRSPIWAVVDPLEGQVTGPMTYPDAEAYIRQNGSYFIGELSIETANGTPDAPDQPAPALSSPVPVRAEQVVPGGYTLTASQVPGPEAAR